MFKRLLLLIAAVLCLGGAAEARQKYQFVACQNGTVIVAGYNSSNSTCITLPNATITVYATGTTNLSTLFADNNGTSKGNPFTAGNDGSFFFYADNGRYDVKVVGQGGVPSFTIGDVLLNDSSGGGGGGSSGVWPPPPSVLIPLPFSATPIFDAGANSYFRMQLTGNVTSSTVINATQGKMITIELLQDSVGGRTVAWPANFVNPPIINAAACSGGAATCNDSSMTKASFYFDGTNWQSQGILPNVASAQMLNPEVLSGRIVVANAFPGTSMTGQANRADAALGTGPGTILILGDANFAGPNGATSIFDYDNLGYFIVHSNHNVKFGCGNFTGVGNSVIPYIMMQSNTSLTGSGPCTKINAPSGQQAFEVISTYASIQALYGGQEQNISLSNFQLIGQQVKQISDLVLNGGLTATSNSANFTAADQGKVLWIPSQVGFGSTLISFVNSTTITLNSNTGNLNGTFTARYVNYNSAVQHISLDNCTNCSVDHVLFTAPTTIALQAGGNSFGTNVHATVALNAGPQTITTGLSNPHVPVRVQIVGNVAGITGNVVFTGTSTTGEPITDTLALNGTTNVFGVNYFSTITQIVVPTQTHGGGGDTVQLKTWPHAENCKFNDNIFTNGVSQNVAIVNGENCEIRRNMFWNPAQIYAPGTSVIDLESNAPNDVVIGNVVDSNQIYAAQSPEAINTGVSFSNNNASRNGYNRITNNIIAGIDPGAAGGVTSNLQNGINLAGGNCPGVGGIHDTEVGGNKVYGGLTNGITITGGCRLEIHHNYVMGSGSAGGAILLSGGVLDSKIHDNILRRNAANPGSDNNDLNSSSNTNTGNVFWNNTTDNLVTQAGEYHYNNYCAGDVPVSAQDICILSFPLTTQPAGTKIEDIPVTITGATPGIANLNYAIFLNGGATTVTNFTSGRKGQVVTFQGDANTTIQNNANIVTRSGANITPFNGLTNTFRFDGAVWRQVN